MRAISADRGSRPRRTAAASASCPFRSHTTTPLQSPRVPAQQQCRQRDSAETQRKHRPAWRRSRDADVPDAGMGNAECGDEADQNADRHEADIRRRRSGARRAPGARGFGSHGGAGFYENIRAGEAGEPATRGSMPLVHRFASSPALRFHAIAPTIQRLALGSLDEYLKSPSTRTTLPIQSVGSLHSTVRGREQTLAGRQDPTSPRTPGITASCRLV